MEASNQVLKGAVENSTIALKKLGVGAKTLRAKKVFLTTLEAYKGNLGGGPTYCHFYSETDTGRERP